MSEDQEVVAAEGTMPLEQAWTLLYRSAGGKHALRLLVNGVEQDAASGFDIPGVTEIGFAGGLRPGSGWLFLYGLVASRIEVVRAESHDPAGWSEVRAGALPGAMAGDGTALRTFMLVRPPIEDVSALVGLDQSGQVVQRIGLSGTALQS